MEKQKKPYWYEAYLTDEEAGRAKIHFRGMPKKKVLEWIWGMDGEFPLYVADIMFFDRASPVRKIVHEFADLDSVIEFMGEKSMTHNILFLSYHVIYISESKDHQTNIDGDVLNKVMEVYG
jgi:hypothetical protein